VERKIQLQAYEMYEQRGRSDGHALDDWFNAEAEVFRGSILSPLMRKAQLGSRTQNEKGAHPARQSAPKPRKIRVLHLTQNPGPEAPHFAATDPRQCGNGKLAAPDFRTRSFTPPADNLT
jgi:hypothetical protein